MAKFSNQLVLPHYLTQMQHNILMGSLLGDGHLSLDARAKYPRLKIERKIEDISYLQWEYDHFQSLCRSEIKRYWRFDGRYSSNKEYCYFRTRNVPAFLTYYQQWYHNQIKIIPFNLELNSSIVAVWFADDGCLSKVGKQLIIKFSTEGFSHREVLFLSQLLFQRYVCKYPIYRKKSGQYFIKSSTQSSKILGQDILPWLAIMGIERKYVLFQNS